MLTSCFFTNDELWESGAVACLQTVSLGAISCFACHVSSCHLIMPGQTTEQVRPRRASSSARLALDDTENSWELLTTGRSCMETTWASGLGHQLEMGWTNVWPDERERRRVLGHLRNLN